MTKQELASTVDRLKDSYGSECTSSGLVRETRATTVREALADPAVSDVGPRPDYDEREWSNMATSGTAKVVVEPFSDFEECNEGPEHDELVTRARQILLEYAKVGDADYDPESDSPGLFFRCLLVRGPEEGVNHLVAFPVVWT